MVDSKILDEVWVEFPSKTEVPNYTYLSVIGMSHICISTYDLEGSNLKLVDIELVYCTEKELAYEEIKSALKMLGDCEAIDIKREKTFVK
jgi:S-adenosylmethionine/arginine decarboxylase-like enzyme